MWVKCYNTWSGIFTQLVNNASGQGRDAPRTKPTSERGFSGEVQESACAKARSERKSSGHVQEAPGTKLTSRSIPSDTTFTREAHEVKGKGKLFETDS